MLIIPANSKRKIVGNVTLYLCLSFFIEQYVVSFEGVLQVQKKCIAPSHVNTYM